MTKHRKEYYSSSSESCDDSHSDSHYYSDSGSSDYSLSETCDSDYNSSNSEVSHYKDKRSSDFRKLSNLRTKRGVNRASKRSAAVSFVHMTKEVLKVWDKGGYITSKFLNNFVKAYKNLLVRRLEQAMLDNTPECECSLREATYIVAIAFCLHYNASGENSEKWKIRFHSLLKYVVSKQLITLNLVDDIFPLDSSGNYFVDVSTNKIIISGVVQNNTLQFSDVSGSFILGPFVTRPGGPSLATQLPGLRDLSVVLETERVLTTNMSLVSQKILAFIDKNVFND
jgi:hypothetical protein